MGKSQSKAVVQVPPGPEELAVYAKAKANGHRAQIVYVPENNYTVTVPPVMGDISKNLRAVDGYFYQPKEGFCNTGYYARPARIAFDCRGNPYYTNRY